MITDEIYEAIKVHFANEWHVTTDRLIIMNGKDSIEVLTTHTGVTTYYLEFTIDYGGTYEDYWGEIEHSELIEEIRHRKIKLILQR